MPSPMANLLRGVGDAPPSPYAWMSARMVSGCTAVFCHVDVAATSASISISLE